MAKQKEAMLALFRQAHQDLQDFLSQLSVEELQQHGSLQAWAAKDILPHLAFWQEHFNQQVEKAQAGEQVPMAGDYYNQINDGVLMEHLEDAFEELQQKEEESYQKGIALLEGMSEEELLDEKKFAFLNGRSLLDRALYTFGWHPLSHVADYLSKNGKFEKAAEIQEKLTESLQPFPNWAANAIYNLGCFYALAGMKDKALEKVGIALGQRKELIDWSKQDADLKSLHEDEAFLKLHQELAQ